MPRATALSVGHGACVDADVSTTLDHSSSVKLWQCRLKVICSLFATNFGALYWQNYTMQWLYLASYLNAESINQLFNLSSQRFHLTRPRHESSHLTKWSWPVCGSAPSLIGPPPAPHFPPDGKSSQSECYDLPGWWVERRKCQKREVGEFWLRRSALKVLSTQLEQTSLFLRSHPSFANIFPQESLRISCFLWKSSLSAARSCCGGTVRYCLLWSVQR